MGLKNLEKKYEGLSPFGLKNKLIDMANSLREKMMLNTGRGNPNWVATKPREAFFLFGILPWRKDTRFSVARDWLARQSQKGLRNALKNSAAATFMDGH
jgi:aspartate 4-decarboxylase